MSNKETEDQPGDHKTEQLVISDADATPFEGEHPARVSTTSLAPRGFTKQDEWKTCTRSVEGSCSFSIDFAENVAQPEEDDKELSLRRSEKTNGKRKKRKQNRKAIPSMSPAQEPCHVIIKIRRSSKNKLLPLYVDGCNKSKDPIYSQAPVPKVVQDWNEDMMPSGSGERYPLKRLLQRQLRDQSSLYTVGSLQMQDRVKHICSSDRSVGGIEDRGSDPPRLNQPLIPRFVTEQSLSDSDMDDKTTYEIHESFAVEEDFDGL